MESHSEVLNHFLVEVFNEILKTEEACLAKAYRDLSLRELHLIEEVCRAVDAGRDNCATAIAAAQRVTAGTLTTGVALLEKKGYLLRQRDEKDKRMVRIVPTEKGREANLRHAKFHEEMVGDLLGVLTEEEAVSFVRGLSTVAAFFRAKHKKTM